MNKSILRLASVTYAIRAQKILEQRGIRSGIKKILQGQTPGGCGYGLELDGAHLQAAQQELSSAGIRILELLRG